ncbi:hypothetical protein MD484_g6376, partial [Candolleomyces efflorescens]
MMTDCLVRTLNTNKIGHLSSIPGSASSSLQCNVSPPPRLALTLELATSSPGTTSAGSDSTSSPISPTASPIPTSNLDQELGVAIIRRALTNPIRTILSNAGEESSVIVGTRLSSYSFPDKFNWWYDAAKGEYADMVQSGIVDSTKSGEDGVGGCGGCGEFVDDE